MPLGLQESLVEYQPRIVGILICDCVIVETVLGGQFDWGGRLRKSNGGAQRFPQTGWKSTVECKGIRELDCETDTSNRVERRT
jgi:hypothetical protein